MGDVIDWFALRFPTDGVTPEQFGDHMRTLEKTGWRQGSVSVDDAGITVRAYRWRSEKGKAA